MGKSPTTSRGESQSPKQSNTASPTRSDVATDIKPDSLKTEAAANAEVSKPLAPPPRPVQQPNGNDTPDLFGGLSGSLSLEPNPFEQSFGGGGQPETPGGTKLPSVAALTSPSSLLPGGGATPFNWGGGSLRTGPLSPAMLSAPANDYFSDTHHLRGGFPTPNESSLRTGLTPGGSGSMFPAASPNSQLYAQLQSGVATPSTLDFHRTAMSAAAAKREQQAQVPQPATSQPQELSNGASIKAETKTFDPHDNDAANGLYMLAQGRNGVQVQNGFSQQQAHAHPAPMPVQPTNTSPLMNGGASSVSGSARGVSEAGSVPSDESEQPRPNTRGKGKRNSGGDTATTNGRRKASDAPAKAPASKKAKTNGGAAAAAAAAEPDDMDMNDSDDDDMKQDKDGVKTKMTDEEKRKNFLERNRVAALKCRQRKKQWLANLQNKVELYSSENDALSAQISQLREEVVNLKTLLLAHKDCPVTQQQGLHGAFMQQTMEPFNTQMNPYGMAGQPMPNPQLGGVPVGSQRRFS